jgi:hypothetical protein
MRLIICAGSIPRIDSQPPSLGFATLHSGSAIGEDEGV